MNIQNICVIFFVSINLCANTYSKDYGSELISNCAAIQLKNCKMINRSIKSEQLSKYRKAFSCQKNGSTSGDTFKIGIPIPDSGMLGIGLDSTANYSTETCRG